MAEEKKTSDSEHSPTEGSQSSPTSPGKLKKLTSDKKRLAALIFVIVLILSGLIGLGLWWKKTRAAAHSTHDKTAIKAVKGGNEEEDEDPAHPPIFMPIDKIVIKLHRGSAPVDHYLQVAINLRLTGAKVNEKIKLYLPIIQHESMLILSSKEFDWLDDVNHKKQLAIELRDKINKIIKGTPEEGIKAVYFDSFILQ